MTSNKIGKICIWSHPCTNQLKIWTEQIVIMLQSRKISQMCIWYEVVTAGWNMNVLEQRLRSPCFPNRLLFVTLPGMGDNNLASVLTRANWIMHHGGKVFARWNDIRRYFYIHPDNRGLHVSYMIRQRELSHLHCDVSKSIMWPPRLMSRQCVWHQCVWHQCVRHQSIWHQCVWHQCIWHQWQPLPGFAF